MPRPHPDDAIPRPLWWVLSLISLLVGIGIALVLNTAAARFGGAITMPLRAVFLGGLGGVAFLICDWWLFQQARKVYPNPELPVSKSPALKSPSSRKK